MTPHDPHAYGRAAALLAELAPSADVDGSDHSPYLRLDALACEAERLGAFAALFPREFSRLGPDALFRSGDTLRGVKLLAELVSERLVPLNLDVLEDDEFGSFRGIPYMPFLYPEEWCELDALPSALQLAALLVRREFSDDEYWDVCGDVEPLDALLLSAEQLSRIPAVLDAGGVLFELEPELAREPRALRALAPCALLAAHASENIFFDGCPDCGTHDHEMDWTRENLERLAAQYKAALLISADIRRLSEWLDVDRPARVVRAVEAWNRAVLAARARRRGGQA